jgi:hypothetical protein
MSSEDRAIAELFTEIRTELGVRQCVTFGCDEDRAFGRPYCWSCLGESKSRENKDNRNGYAKDVDVAWGYGL